MNIVIQDINNIRKIVVQGLSTQNDIDRVLDGLKVRCSLEISFLNIQYLPKDIVIALKNIKEEMKITTNESVLKSYLMTLGFDIVYINHYKTNKIKALDLQALALGGSAGSLAKFIEIIKELPKSDISVFAIMHQKSDQESVLSSVLQKYTSVYNVVEAQSDMKIKPATIYTIPSNKHLIVAGGFIFLTDEEKRNFSRPSISTTFESLSNEYKHTLLSVIVCGYGNDASDSLDTLQENGTTVIVEDPIECEAKPMLTNAIATKQIDHVFSIEKINSFISSYINTEIFTAKELDVFLKKVDKKYGYDYSGYNLKHIQRRIHLFYNTLKPKDFLDFENKVLQSSSIFRDLFLNISVNITTFYRNPEVFKILREELLPKLDSFLDIKIWCAGCSSGEEPYSIAIILKELGLLDKSLIYATDLNEVILENAKNGLYSKDSYNMFLKNYYKAGGSESFSRYFTDYDDFVQINDNIKENILFFRHNLVLDGKMNDFQLIFCRNVLIYFDKDLKAKVFNLFNESLDNYGFLVLGESESLNMDNSFKTIDEKNKIYKRNI